jgi:hypothetical protein
MAYTESMRNGWDKFALAHGTIFHSTGFRQILLESFGYECGYHAVVDGHNRIRALIPLVVGRNLGLRKAGVSLPFANYADICAASEDARHFALEAVLALKDLYRLDYIELRLKDHQAEGSRWNVNLQNHTFVLPLAADEDKVLALSSASNRNHVRKAYKNNWFEASFAKEHLAPFYSVYLKRMKQLGSPAPDILFFKRFFDYLPDNAFLLSVLDRQTGKVVGGMLLLTSPGNATLYYPYGANLVEYNAKYLNNFMYWEAVRFGINKGMGQLDLGRSQTGSGTYKYKQQWGARAEQLKYLSYSGGGAAAGPPDRDKFHIFVELWKAAPAFITNFAGRHLIKYLMP